MVDWITSPDRERMTSEDSSPMTTNPKPLSNSSFLTAKQVLSENKGNLQRAGKKDGPKKQT